MKNSKIKKLILNGLRPVANIFALLALLALLPACKFESNKGPAEKQGPTKTKGPSTGGGGDATSSEVENVEHYINKYLRDRLKTVFHRVDYYRKQPREESSSNVLKLPKQILDMVAEGNIQNFIDSILIIVTQGDCPGEYHEAKDGSAYDNTICLSSTRLSRIPPEILRREIHALAAHELAHLMGADEVDAKAVQNWFLQTTMASFTSSDILHNVYTEFVSYQTEIIDIVRATTELISDKGGLTSTFDTSYLCERILLFDNKDSFDGQSQFYPERIIGHDDTIFIVNRMSNLYSWYCRDDDLKTEEDFVALLNDLKKAFWIVRNAQTFLLEYEDIEVTYPELLYPSSNEVFYLHEIPSYIDLLLKNIELSEFGYLYCQRKFDDGIWFPMDIQESSTFWGKGESHRGLDRVGVFKGPKGTEFNLKMYSYYPKNYGGIKASLFIKLMAQMDGGKKIPRIEMQPTESILPSKGKPLEPTAMITGGYNDSFHMKLKVEGHPLEVKCEIHD